MLKCCVFNCSSSNYNKLPGITFHRFSLPIICEPADHKLLEAEILIPELCSVKVDDMSLVSLQGKKENFRLLDLSTEDESEDLQLEIIPSRKKKVTRRDRSRGQPLRSQGINIGEEVRCALRWAMRATLLLWMVMLTWFCASLYDQVSTMDLNLQQKVSTSSKSVDDALQTCHTAARDLKANTRNLSERLDALEQKHFELVKIVEKATGELSAVSEQLSAAPKLADTPKRLAELQRTVADFGSQINGFDGALQSARKQALTAVTGVEEVKTLLHDLEGRTNDTIANVSATSKAEEDFRSQVAAINASLAKKVEDLMAKVEELRKPASTPAPTTSSSTSSTTTPAPITTTTLTTPILPPGAPVKPIVLGTS